MTMDDGGKGADFEKLDVRAAQAALADAFEDQDGEAASVTGEDQEDGAKTSETDETANAAGPDALEDGETEASDAEPIEWTEEERTEHARMAEALLFAAVEPLDVRSIADRLPTGADVQGALARLAEDYAQRGVILKSHGGRWRLTTAPDLAHVLEKHRITPRRLSRAALETLAIIAYHQPCTRADIEDVRGVQVAKGSVDQLLEIGWIKIRGKRMDTPGRPALFGTTQKFLEHFDLESVRDLPGMADLKAAGLLDARLPTGFSVPSPVDGDEAIDDDEIEAESGEFAEDYLDDGDPDAADA
ncbi:MAG: SMC-Scp complex subunit ScpB [Pseudomonadota bacterium]